MKNILSFILERKLVLFLLLFVCIVLGILVAPFDFNVSFLPRNQVPVDAIPNIGENQQIVFTRWEGRSPQDVEDQITYPLTTSLLGIPKVKVVRSYSYFGFSSIYLIFGEDASWDWSRAKILEKLSSLPPKTLPTGVSPSIGPDATALGQVFWYTLEGVDKNGKKAEGWASHELRSIQDFQVRYALQAVEGVAEVASIGGFVKEYQIDVNPNAMRTYGVTLHEIFNAVKRSNKDVGARTIEINQVEYVIRGKGLIRNLDDLKKTVIKAREGQPVTLEQIAHIHYGPALRRGALDKGGNEAVGGVVVSRYGANPLQVIENIKQKITEISKALPEKTLSDGRISKVRIIPFYDRTNLIHETLNTLKKALTEEMLITILVVLILLARIRPALLVSLTLPLAVLFTFILMKFLKIDANIVALSGIAIAIGTIVDMGIIIVENIVKNLDKSKGKINKPTRSLILSSSNEVSSAILTAVLTTIVSFLPVFAMEGPEGKLFKPLAYTKTFVLISSIFIALFILPSLAELFLRKKKLKNHSKTSNKVINISYLKKIPFILTLGILIVIISLKWSPLGINYSYYSHILNILFVFFILFLILASVFLFMRLYPKILLFFLRKKWVILLPIIIFVALGGLVWKNLGKEFMPNLDEGSFLYMPTTMPHASIGTVLDIIKRQDIAIEAIPEVESAIGKIGRVNSPLDPAPISMIETIINYKKEWSKDENGKMVRNWRDHIKTPDDIWKEITKSAEVTGVTGAPKLQPISARIVMLQSGMRAPMGLKIFGNNIEALEKVGLEIEKILKKIPEIDRKSVLADRIIGKPYLEIDLNRKKMARYGIDVERVMNVIEVAIGGKTLMHTIEGRERYPVQIRYPRELRGTPEDIKKILIGNPRGVQIPLEQLAKINYVKGPMAIKSEDTFLVNYVVFDKVLGYSEVEVVEKAQKILEEKIRTKELILPNGVTYRFTGSYENQIRAEKKLLLVIPLSLIIIFVLLYLQFKSIQISLFVFAGVFVAWSGGFILIYLYNQGWFLNFDLFGISPREIFNVHSINLSVAVWVGFLALFGIATDDGVLMATKIKQNLSKATGTKKISKKELIKIVHKSALERNRPAMITTATTLIALLPILSSNGRGADIMIPMAIPTFGGMLATILTVFLVPVLYLYFEERKLKNKSIDS